MTKNQLSHYSRVLIHSSLLFLSTLLIYPSAHAVTELARVDKQVITLEELNKKHQDSLRFFQFRSPSKKEVLEDLIKREVGILEAKKMGLDRDPEIMDRMNTVLYHAMLDKKLSKDIEKIFISDEEAKKYYEKNPELRTSHIFAAVKPDATAEEELAAKAKLERIVKEYLVKEKRTFSEVAQSFSEGIAAPVGGDIDYQTKDKLDPAYYSSALSLKVGEYTPSPVRTKFGWHIIRLTAKKSWSDLVDKPQVKRFVIDERKAELFENLMAQLKKSYKVTVKEDLIPK